MSLLLAGLALGLLAIVAALASPSRVRVALVGTLGALAAALVGAAAVATLAGRTTRTATISSLLPFASLHLRLDALGAAVELVVALVAVAAQVFAVGYARGRLRSRTATVLQGLFVLALLVVPVAGDVTTFLFAWELMALASLALLLVDHERPSARAAAVWYGAMTQGGAAAITLGLLAVVRSTHATSFAAMAAARPGTGALGVVAFVLTAAGFASKAGAVPLHVWLPRAHPEAPTPVSALMSGAMTALGLYGVARVDLGVLVEVGRGWWIGLLVVGVLSALFGALHAVTSTDLKRLLAYSTIDAMGLGLAGLAGAGVLRAEGRPGVAATLVVGVLALLLAHGAFKALLFLASGVVERTTGTRDLDRLGGLASLLPRTTAAVAVAAGSAASVPLGAGFVGEWILVEGFVAGLGRSAPGGVATALVGLVGVALTSGLTAVAMVKLLGVGFLGRARAERPASGDGEGRATSLALGLLALVTVGAGVLPGPLVAVLARAARDVVGPTGAGPTGSVTSLTLASTATALHPLGLAGGAVVLVGLVVLLARGGSRVVRATRAWACGRSDLSPRMQYTATSFAEPVQRVFADVLRPTVDVTVSHEEESREIESVLAYRSRVDDAVERALYEPLVRAHDALGRRARILANGSVHRYLAYGFVALLIVLVVLG